MTQPKPHPRPWRTGRRYPRNIYDANDVGIAMAPDEETARRIVEGVNARTQQFTSGQLVRVVESEHPEAVGQIMRVRSGCGTSWDLQALKPLGPWSGVSWTLSRATTRLEAAAEETLAASAHQTAAAASGILREESCWHCGDVVLVPKPRCERCPTECDVEGCDELGCEVYETEPMPDPVNPPPPEGPSDLGENTAAGPMTRTIRELVRACQVCIEEEQSKPLPDNHVIAVLCDSIRMAREYVAYARANPPLIRAPEGPSEPSEELSVDRFVEHLTERDKAESANAALLAQRDEDIAIERLFRAALERISYALRLPGSPSLASDVPDAAERQLAELAALRERAERAETDRDKTGELFNSALADYNAEKERAERAERQYQEACAELDEERRKVGMLMQPTPEGSEADAQWKLFQHWLANRDAEKRAERQRAERAERERDAVIAARCAPSETIAFLTQELAEERRSVEELSDLIRESAPLTWAASQDADGAHAWEIRAKELLDRLRSSRAEQVSITDLESSRLEQIASVPAVIEWTDPSDKVEP